MRYECSTCGQGTETDEVKREHRCDTPGCTAVMVPPEETPFEVWWLDEHRVLLHHVGLGANGINDMLIDGIKRVARIAWYNGAYKERYQVKL